MLPLKKLSSTRTSGRIIPLRAGKMTAANKRTAGTKQVAASRGLRKRKGKWRTGTIKRKFKRLAFRPRAIVPLDPNAELSGPVYNKGYDRGYDKGYDKGFRDGKHTGGDGIVDACLPEYQIMPDTTVEEIIAAGVEALRSRIYHMLTASELGESIVAALDHRRPFSLVRLGDGELLTLAQESILSIEQIKEDGEFLPYAGVHVPDLAIKAELIAAVKGATVVGIPKLRVRNFQPLAFAVFREEQMDFHHLLLTDSLVNYYLYQAGYLSRMTLGRRVLLVGNLAPSLAATLRNHGVNVVGEIAPVEGVKDIPRIKAAIAAHDFDIALVSAGISAVILAEWIASAMGKVAIDFGHLADSIVKGEAPFR
ncbi:GT-D fold domain-containing protein [Paenibacillus aestuarii]|uniref:GT-D fold domain-containing glycosyltransferase n=1 Tax=Paenibacillus aestuarii TaxID=516965 RepID=A0ABW0K267_9BACL|nr:GT-D fold domain-containing glycosyltransferase [Paenibacillus aestuarii]